MGCFTVEEDRAKVLQVTKAGAKSDAQLHMSQGRSTRCIGDKPIPPLIGNPYNGYINPYYWVDEFIPYYMEIMGVDRPDRTHVGFWWWQLKDLGILTPKKLGIG